MGVERFFKPAVRAISAYHVDLPPVRCKLNQNESPFDFPAELKEEVFQVLRETAWNRYPELRPTRVRALLAESLGVSPDMILVGKGSNEILQMLLTATIQPGTSAIYCPPTFSMIAQWLTIFGATGHRVPLGPGFRYPVDEVVATAREHQPSLLFIVSPNNPTGTWVSRGDVERLLTETSSLVVLDQAYAQYADDPMLDLLDTHENLVVFRTFSKALQLAGCRLGFCVARPKVIAELDKALLPFNFDHFSVAATLVALRHPGQFEAGVQAIRAERDRVIGALRAIPGMVTFDSAANFILFSVAPEINLWQRMLEQGVLIRPFGRLDGNRDFLRVTVGTAEENDLFLECLGKALA